jgi:hypothetical protein
MSLKANYFKLGLFVIGAIVAGLVVLVIIGSGRWFQPKLTIETYFNESVQGLDIGSKLKYRGVAIGDVTRIGFSYNKYQLDRPVTQRVRYVLVEAQIQPKLLGGRAVTGDLTEPANAKMEVEKGLRIRLAPQGITGTSYLEIDYVDPPPPLLPIDWTPDNIYIPSSSSTVTQIVSAASDILETLRKLDLGATLANLNKLLVTANTGSTRSIPRRSRRDARARQAGNEARSAPDGQDRQRHRGADRGPADDRAAAVRDSRRSRVEEAARRRGPRRCRSGSWSRIRTSPSRSRTCRARSRGSIASWAAAKPISSARSTICARSPTTCARSPRTRSNTRRN